MPDWDADGPQLRQNLAKLLRQIRDEARQRLEPSLESARRWHRMSLQGLTVPNTAMVGRFRGEPGLEGLEVQIGLHLGVASMAVSGAVSEFERRLQRAVRRLDALIPVGSELDADQLAAVLNLCAWAHAEWVRIHPFANGNGRSARLWANSLAMRYGLPPFIRLRPRPDGNYASAGEAAMRGDEKRFCTVDDPFGGFLPEGDGGVASCL
jgi:fido (protein-threonine AMPylation protein)